MTPPPPHDRKQGIARLWRGRSGRSALGTLGFLTRPPAVPAAWIAQPGVPALPRCGLASTLALVVVAGGLASPPLHAADACRIEAHVRTGLPDALPMRAAPDTGSAVIALMPMVNDPDRGRMGASVTITAIRDGHAAVTDVRPWDGAVTPLEGWVATRDLAFVVQTCRGFAAPDPSASAVWSADDGISPDMIADIVCCRDDWGALRLADATVVQPVWVRGACGGQETTCDGVHGDRCARGTGRG